MSNGRIKLDLERRVDQNGKTYYISKVKSPIVIDCGVKNPNGVTFLVFVSEEGYEELHIAPLENNSQVNKKLQPQVYINRMTRESSKTPETTEELYTNFPERTK